MSVLGDQNYTPPSYLHPQHQSTPKNTFPLSTNPIQNHNNFLSEKKKPMNIKTKPNLPSDFHFEDFKQNHLKSKPSQQNPHTKNRTSDRHYQMTPFSSVLNMKPQPKINQLIKPMPKAQQSEALNQQKKDQQFRPPKQQTKKYIEKMIENKLNHMIENKRKSASFKAAPWPKQNFVCAQKRKQSYHVNDAKLQKNDRQEENRQKQERKHMVVNKKKNSLSFMIRKKINSNATQSQRHCDKIGQKNQGINSFEKEEFMRSQNSKYSYEGNSFNGNNTSQNSVINLTKYSYRPMQDKLKKVRERHGQNKDMLGKVHNLKGMKCLKVRVNKVLKAQEQLFNEKYFPQKNNEETIDNKNGTQDNQRDAKKEQVRFQEQKVERTQDKVQLVERLITIEQILKKKTKKGAVQLSLEQPGDRDQRQIRQQNLIGTQQSKNNNSAQPVIQAQNAQNENKLKRGQLKWKSYKQSQIQPNPTNRKRISSIRAIKNYYKKLDTQHHASQKSSFLISQKESKQTATIKKKDRQSTACLTHKIKWGNSSKKKLNSDRIPPDPFKFTPQFSIDPNKDHIKQQKFTQKYKMPTKLNSTIKASIQAKQFDSAKTKKPFNKVQFLEEQFMKAKDLRTPKAEKNLQKIFAQTINSKEFIDSDPIPFHAGSKSLIIFQDPGISMIITNNNSIHSPTYPIGFNGQLSKEVGKVEINDLSPVAMMKKRACDIIEEKCDEQINPLESLQELYFELKSRKDINPRQKDRQMRIQSLEELCQG